MSRHDAGPGLEDTVVISLAAARIARAVSVDQISSRARERLSAAAARSSTSGIRGPALRSVADLVACPICTGWWASLATSMIWPGRYRFRRALSAAGLQVLLTFPERILSEAGRAAAEQTDRS